MEHISPLGPVYQAGTLSGNPVAMAAGLTCLQIIGRDGFYDAPFRHTEQLVQGMQGAADKAGVPFTTNHAGTMFGGFFTDEPKVTQYSQVINSDTERFSQFFHSMLDSGIYLAPASFEAGFMSAAHSDADIEATIDAAAKAFASL
jgi:glutamate-1-semialdehyde 2,1-aminomutase